MDHSLRHSDCTTSFLEARENQFSHHSSTSITFQEKPREDRGTGFDMTAKTRVFYPFNKGIRGRALTEITRLGIVIFSFTAAFSLCSLWCEPPFVKQCSFEETWRFFGGVVRGGPWFEILTSCVPWGPFFGSTGTTCRLTKRTTLRHVRYVEMWFF